MEIKKLPLCKCEACGYITWCWYSFTEGTCSKCGQGITKKLPTDQDEEALEKTQFNNNNKS